MPVTFPSLFPPQTTVSKPTSYSGTSCTPQLYASPSASAPPPAPSQWPSRRRSPTAPQTTTCTPDSTQTSRFPTTTTAHRGSWGGGSSAIALGPEPAPTLRPPASAFRFDWQNCGSVCRRNTQLLVRLNTPPPQLRPNYSAADCLSGSRRRACIWPIGNPAT